MADIEVNFDAFILLKVKVRTKLITKALELIKSCCKVFF